MAPPTIPQFFEGKRIFITGATGFMGKVLVEKLLRSCNSLETIYILVRGKRGTPAERRWGDLTQLPCFDRLKTEYPTALEEKIKIVEGDVREPKMGLSDEDYQRMVDQVDIIFHVAASVRFNDALPEAIRMNTYGTKNVLDLATQIKHLLAFIHVSTTYCYCRWQRELEEKVYPMDIDWETAIKISENVDPVSFDILCKKFTNFAPNTYVFSKALAEQIVNDYKDRIPVVIFRPSIVISSWKEPIPGWIDNVNGPIGLIIAGGKGVIRIALTNPDAVPDYMAVDISIKAMIIAAWKIGVERQTKPLGDIEVYNSSSTSSTSISNRRLLELCSAIHMDCPINEVIWAPCYDITKSTTVYKLRAIVSHYFFALVVDFLLRLFGRAPMLLKIHIKIHNAMMALGYFTTKEWTFRNTKFRALNNYLLPQDRTNFDFSFDDLDPLDFFRTAALGGRRYILHEDESSIPQAKKKAQMLVILDQSIKWISMIVIAYYLFTYTYNFLTDTFFI